MANGTGWTSWLARARGRDRRAGAGGRGLPSIALVLLTSAAIVFLVLIPSASAQSITGYTEPATTGTVNADTTGTVTSACPTGEVVVGGGYQLSTTTNALVTESEPAAGGTVVNNQWEVTVENSSGNGTAVTVTVTAVCVSNSISGYEERTNNQSVGASTAVDVTATCSTGNFVVGGGFTVPSSVENFASEPTRSSNLANNVWTTSVDNTGTVSQTVTTVAICVSGPLPGYEEQLIQNSNIGAGSNTTVSAACSTGNVVLGGGAQVENPAVVRLASEQPASGGSVSNSTWSAAVENHARTVEEANVVEVCATLAPTVTVVKPPLGSATGGTNVTIAGSNFLSGATVAFGGKAATNVSVVSPTQLTATSPSGADVVDVTVTTSGGTSATSARDQFKYVPSVSGVSPSAGATSGGTGVTITGAGLTGATAVDFGGNPATTFTVNNDSSIAATAPAGSAGAVDVTVTTPGGTSATSNNDKYTYDAAPTVTAVNPPTGPTGGGNTVTITGTNFLNGATVAFGANAATNVTVNSATQITAHAPAGSPGTADVKVTTPGGTSATSNNDKYTYDAAPTVTAVSPPTGPTGGGNTVTITGTNFLNGATVAFGANAATNVTVNSATQITAHAPAGSPGTVDVKVTTPGGTSATSNNDKYTYTTPVMPATPPSVSGINPSSGPQTGGTQITVSGSNLDNASMVSFGSSAGSIVSDSASQIVVKSPAGSGTVDVTVTTPGGSSPTNSQDRFSYTAPPAVLSSTTATPSPSAANASATVATGNLPTTVHWEYGLDQSERPPGFTGNLFDQSTPDQALGAGSAPQPVSVQLTGLIPHAHYKLRLVASNAAGSTIAPEQDLFTPAAPPPPRPVLGKANVAPSGACSCTRMARRCR